MNNTKNITLNSQIDYWNGQKKSVSKKVSASREGKGMNSQQQNFCCEKNEKASFIKYNNGIKNYTYEKIKYFETLRQSSLDNISELYIDFYIQLWQMTQLRKSTRLQRWTNASRINWNAGIFLMKTYFTQEPITVSNLQNKMHITRTSARKIISDMLGEEWIKQIEVKDDKRKLGYIVTHQFYKNWEQYVSILISKANLQDWQKSYNLHDYATKTLDKIMHT